MKFWKLNEDKTVERIYDGSYEKPYPSDIIDDETVDPQFYIMDPVCLRHDNGVLRYMTDEEKVIVFDQRELERQTNKSLMVKTIENNFYKLCFSIFGDMTKRGFDELNTAIQGLKVSNFPLAVELGLLLTSVNQEAVREIGIQWWDDAAWHPEIES